MCRLHTKKRARVDDYFTRQVTEAGAPERQASSRGILVLCVRPWPVLLASARRGASRAGRKAPNPAAIAVRPRTLVDWARG